MDIDDILSPCDQILINAASAQIDALGFIKDTLRGRNSEHVLGSVVVGILVCVIYRLCNIEVPHEKLMEFLSSQIKDEE